MISKRILFFFFVFFFISKTSHSDSFFSMSYGQDAAEEIKTDFMLADTIYTTATIPSADNVCLWLGV
jgi:hypothetical protein